MSWRCNAASTQEFGRRKCWISITEIEEIRIYNKEKYGDNEYKKGVLVRVSNTVSCTDSNSNTNGKEEASDDEDDASIDTDTNTNTTTTTLTSTGTLSSTVTMPTSTTSTPTMTSTETSKHKKYRKRYRPDSFRRDERSWNESMKEMTANIAAMQLLKGLQCYDDYWIGFMVYLCFWNR